MLEFEELRQLIAFADHGTLSKAAESMNISQPTFTRTMKSLEDKFGVSLFSRGKNKIELNDTGLLAVERARMLLAEIDDTIRAVKDFDRAKKTIRIESCAPAPLWSYIPDLGQKHPDKAIFSELKDIDEIIKDVSEGSCEIGIIPYSADIPEISCRELMSENLSVVLVKDHPAYEHAPKSLSLADLNGHNCLLRSQIGFWDKLCRDRMPSSRFLVQEDDFEFFELIKTSTLPFFITNLVNASDYVSNDRVVIPISDAEANVTYFTIQKK